jgi:hypothetical protein
MPKSVVEDDTPLRPSTVTVRRDVVTTTSTYEPAYSANPEMAVLRGGLGNRQQIEDELDDIAGAMRGFWDRAPDQVLRECSAYGARLTEMCVLLHRAEGLDRQLLRVRTMQVQRYQDELSVQFKIASRLIESARQEIAMLGGLT